MRRHLFVLLLFASPVFAVPAPPAQAIDDSQARRMVEFLRAVAEHRDARQLIDGLMSMKGTALVIAQQNVSRSVTPDQYREVLLAVAEHREPQLSVPEGNSRAARGKEGLLRDILPSLRWGSEHLDLLSSRTAMPGRLGKQARKLALENLPASLPLNVPLYLVMGGRAGAAANDEGIYFDVLATSFRNPDHYPQLPQITEFFAHEMHHVALGGMLDRLQSRLDLDENRRMAFDLLRGLVLEGSASYLINGHRDLPAMRKDPMFAAPGNDQSRLAAVEQVLAGVLQQDWSRERYDESMARFSGNALHITGATMLDAIWKDGGRRAVIAVMGDPRKLLLRYNQGTQNKPQAFRFSPDMARAVAALGD